MKYLIINGVSKAGMTSVGANLHGKGLKVAYVIQITVPLDLSNFHIIHDILWSVI